MQRWYALSVAKQKVKFEILWQLTKSAYCSQNKIWHIQWNGSDFPVDFIEWKISIYWDLNTQHKWIKNTKMQNKTKPNIAIRILIICKKKNDNRVTEVTSQPAKILPLCNLTKYSYLIVAFQCFRIPFFSMPFCVHSFSLNSMIHVKNRKPSIRTAL